MEPSILQRDSIVVVGLSRQYGHGDKSGIPAQWGDFHSRMHEIPQIHERFTYGVSDCPGDLAPGMHFRYTPALEVEPDWTDVPEGLTRIVLPAGTYARFTHVGPVSRIGESFEAFFQGWLPMSEFQRNGTHEFELYDERFNGCDPESAENAFDYFVPVVRSAGTADGG